MKPLRLPPARLGLADIAILCLLGGVIAVVVSFAREFEAPFPQAVRIGLSPAALPWYTLYSLSRGVLALLISYLFALGFGWAAAKSPAAERLLLPLLDILQSIPVLGFLPGLVLGLMSLFPTRNVGLQLAAILMIFTAQAWNLALSFYNSLKSLPQPLREACKVAAWPPGRTFRPLDVRAAARGRGGGRLAAPGLAGGAGVRAGVPGRGSRRCEGGGGRLRGGGGAQARRSARGGGGRRGRRAGRVLSVAAARATGMGGVGS